MVGNPEEGLSVTEGFSNDHLAENGRIDSVEIESQELERSKKFGEPDSEAGPDPKKRVAFLLLDGVELDTIDLFRKEGVLPNLDRLISTGSFKTLESRDNYAAEATPTEMITGQTSEEIRYWSLMEFDTETYRCFNTGAYRGPAFYDRPDLKSIVFDVPHMKIDENAPGIQVAAWGAHSAQFPRSSNPPNVIVDIEAEFGTQHNPEFEDIHASHNVEWGRGVTDHMVQSLITRPKIVGRLTELEPDWDLLFVGATECHVHEHAFHHCVDPDHVLYSHPTTPQLLVFMREVFVAIDKMVGEVEALLPEGTTFIVGSVHGAKPSAADSTAILGAELIYRDQTGNIGLELPLHLDGPIVLEDWERARGYMQRYKVAPGKPTVPGFKQALMHYTRWASHKYTPGKIEYAIEKLSRKIQGQTSDWWIGKKNEPLTEPIDISGPLPRIEIASEPSNWFSGAWPEMRFFAIPGFSTMHVRVNLKGREEHGIVEPEDYETALQEIEDLLAPMTDAKTGEPVVERFARMRLDDPLAIDGPSADMVLVLKAAITIDHPTYGRLGTIPFARVAEHSERGWLSAIGNNIQQTSDGVGRPIDIAPSLLGLLGLEAEERCHGSSLYEHVKESVTS